MHLDHIRTLFDHCDRGYHVQYSCAAVAVGGGDGGGRKAACYNTNIYLAAWMNAGGNRGHDVC